MNTKYAPLFTSYTLNNGVVIKNRLAVAPMTHFSSNEDGTLSKQEAIFLQNRANDIGIFITAATLVSENGKAFQGEPEALYESQLKSLIETATLIKKQGAKAILQLHHGGIKSVPSLLKGQDKIGASDDEETQTREATENEILQLVQSFAKATALAIQAGFDGVEIHGANHYLIQQFFSAHTNKRRDQWGGTLENRLRFPMAVIDAVVATKEKLNRNDFIIGYRFSPEEDSEHGLTMADTFDLIDALVTKPLQYLHVSLSDFYSHVRRGGDTHSTRIELIHNRIKGKLPLIGVGRLYTADQILSAYETGWAEFIALGRTVMINPTIGTLIKEGKVDQIETTLDPNKADHYGIPDVLWSMCIQGGEWLPPLKNNN